ncbi:MAG: hypothetical protein HZC02_01695 [Candidatus Levybacteria bacterium]|nr:hypothetical protein [Candidatus Levybacteria bacterium]
MSSGFSNRSDNGVSIGIFFAQGEGSPRAMIPIDDPNNANEEIYLVTVPRDQLHAIGVWNVRDQSVFVVIDKHGSGIIPDTGYARPREPRVFNGIPIRVESNHEVAVFTVTVTEDVLLLENERVLPEIRVTKHVRQVTFIVTTAAHQLREPIRLLTTESVVVIHC